ncbi:hypothetical protein HYH03_016586 [Edaphochlamys debaryana]|uniref:Uncharacterized protein n=1 Tax=Edaphochlamys debaryana TaxID=47281 RepID=A0A836BQ46_9CHLO|nr:hypothetical protein HYH03_016586 [Edaphochlamys debaryana]|eukprot:KAG2484632.1 hypothetical protein HYH03_016586 [Edaphochlamys debaryana]
MAHNVADLLVVGGGPSGLLVASACRAAGFSVTILEQAPSVGGWTYKGDAASLAGPADTLLLGDEDFAAALPPRPTIQDTRLHLAAYAAFHNVTSSVRANCRLVSLERLEPARGGAQAEATAMGRQWRLVFEDSSPGQGGSAQQAARYALTADFVILATGQPQPPKDPAELLPPAQAALIPPGCRLVHASAATTAELEAAGGAWVVGDGDTAVDAASAAALLMNGRGVRLLKTGPAGVCVVDGINLLDSARRRALGAAMQPHPALPAPSAVGRTLRAPTKRRFWAHLGSKVKAALSPKGGKSGKAAGGSPGLSNAASQPEPPALALPPTASTNSGADGGSAPQLVVWAPSLEDPRVLPFLGPSLRAALLRPPGVEGSAGGSGAHACLYRGMLHPDVPGLAFVGLEAHAGTSLLLHQLQARWLVSYLTTALPPPSHEAMRADLARQRAWRAAALAVPYMSRHGSLAAAGERGYAAQLLSDLEGLVALRREGGHRAAAAMADGAGHFEAVTVRRRPSAVSAMGAAEHHSFSTRRFSDRLIGAGSNGPQRRASTFLTGDAPASPRLGADKSSYGTRLVLSVTSQPFAPYLEQKLRRAGPRRATTTSLLYSQPTSADGSPSVLMPLGGPASPGSYSAVGLGLFQRHSSTSVDQSPQQRQASSALGGFGGGSKRRFGTGVGGSGSHSRGNSNSGRQSLSGRRESDLSAQLHHLSSRTGVDMAVLADLLTDDGAGGGGLGGGGGPPSRRQSASGRPPGPPRPTLAMMRPPEELTRPLDPVLSVGSMVECSQELAAAAMAAAAAAASVVRVTIMYDTRGPGGEPTCDDSLTGPVEGLLGSSLESDPEAVEAAPGHQLPRSSRSGRPIGAEAVATTQAVPNSPLEELKTGALLFGASSGKRYTFTAGGLVSEPSEGGGPAEPRLAAWRGPSGATSPTSDPARWHEAASAAAAAAAVASSASPPPSTPAGSYVQQRSSTFGPSGCVEYSSKTELDDSDAEGFNQSGSGSAWWRQPTGQLNYRPFCADRWSRSGAVPNTGAKGDSGMHGGRAPFNARASSAQPPAQSQVAAGKHAFLISNQYYEPAATPTPFAGDVTPEHMSPTVPLGSSPTGGLRGPVIVAPWAYQPQSPRTGASQRSGKALQSLAAAAGAAASPRTGSPLLPPSPNAAGTAGGSSLFLACRAQALSGTPESPGSRPGPRHRVSAGGKPAVGPPRRRHTSSCLYPHKGSAVPAAGAVLAAAGDAIEAAMAATANFTNARRVASPRVGAPELQR